MIEETEPDKIPKDCQIKENKEMAIKDLIGRNIKDLIGKEIKGLKGKETKGGEYITKKDQQNLKR